MKIQISILSCVLACLTYVKCSTTRQPDVAPVLLADLAESQTNIGYDTVAESLSHDSVLEKIGNLPEGVVIEPVSVNNNLGIKILPRDKNVQIPILIKDDNLMIKPSPEITTPKPILIRDDNLNLTPKPILIRDDNLNLTPKPILIRDDNLNLTPSPEVETSVVPLPEPASHSNKVQLGEKTTEGDLTTPISVTITDATTDSTDEEILPEHMRSKSCPDFKTRYEEGKFIVTLDDGKCEMVVSERNVEKTQNNKWAAGRNSPVYRLLARKYKPEVTFRPTALAPEEFVCQHRTRQSGNFFIVDTILGRCQMAIGIPTLPDLRYILGQRPQRVPTWNQPMRRMPTWPRPIPDESDQSSDD